MITGRRRRLALALVGLPVAVMAGLFIWAGTAEVGLTPTTPIGAAELYINRLPRLCEANLPLPREASPQAECWSSYVSIRSISIRHNLVLGPYLGKDRGVVAVDLTCRRERQRPVHLRTLPPSESGMTEPTRPCGFILIFERPPGQTSYELIAAVPKADAAADLKALATQPIAKS